METAESMLTSLESDVGNAQRLDSAGNWVSRRDSFDQARIDEAVNATGGANPLPTAPGTLPAHNPGTAYIDTDGDGMPDEWETRYGTSNTSLVSDVVADGDYTFIEHFLNGTNPRPDVLIRRGSGMGWGPGSVSVLRGPRMISKKLTRAPKS